VGFHYTYLKECHFHFLVASRQVGFAICALQVHHVLPPLAGEGGGGENEKNAKRKKKINHGSWSRAASLSDDRVIELILLRSSFRIPPVVLRDERPPCPLLYQRRWLKRQRARKSLWAPKPKPPPDVIAIEAPIDGTKAGCTCHPAIMSPHYRRPFTQYPTHLDAPSPLSLNLDTAATSSVATALLDPALMANFAINPEPFIPPAMVLEDGGPHRRAWTMGYLRGGDNKTHESYAITIAQGNEDLTAAQRHHLLHDITHYINVLVWQLVRSLALHPHGIGIFRLRNACERDTLVSLGPHFIGPRQINFVPHNEAPMNFKTCTSTRKCWVMLLGYTLDLKEAPILTQV
jgi:hypothetical protein